MTPLQLHTAAPINHYLEIIMPQSFIELIAGIISFVGFYVFLVLVLSF